MLGCKDRDPLRGCLSIFLHGVLRFHGSFCFVCLFFPFPWFNKCPCSEVKSQLPKRRVSDSFTGCRRTEIIERLKWGRERWGKEERVKWGKGDRGNGTDLVRSVLEWGPWKWYEKGDLRNGVYRCCDRGSKGRVQMCFQWRNNSGKLGWRFTVQEEETK